MQGKTKSAAPAGMTGQQRRFQKSGGVKGPAPFRLPVYGLNEPVSGEVVNHGPLTENFENFLHKLEMRRMHLIGLLGGFVRENHVQRDLIGLIHNRAVTRHHFPGVKIHHSRKIL